MHGMEGIVQALGSASGAGLHENGVHRPGDRLGWGPGRLTPSWSPQDYALWGGYSRVTEVFPCKRQWK